MAELARRASRAAESILENESLMADLNDTTEELTKIARFIVSVSPSIP